MKTIGSAFGITAEVPPGPSDEAFVKLQAKACTMGGVMSVTVSTGGQISIIVDRRKLRELHDVTGKAIAQLERQDAAIIDDTAVVPAADIHRTAAENANAQVVS